MLISVIQKIILGGAVIGSAFLLTSCSDWALKERCEKANWFEYSRDVANSGRYLEEDGFVKDCKGVDRTNSEQLDLGFKLGRSKYCLYESFVRNGESGEPVNFKMCDNLQLYQMQKSYGDGLERFCTAAVGYKFGASGKVYKNTCFKDKEKFFIGPYYTGRKEYLERKVQQLTQEVALFEKTEKSLSGQIDNLMREITALPSPKECRSENVYDKDTKTNHWETICEEAGYIRSRRSELYSYVDPLRSNYRELSAQVVQKIETLAQIREELGKIPVVVTE